MARTIGKLLLLQIIGFLCTSTTAQYEDLEDYSGGSGSFSGDTSDPTFVDYEQDYDYGDEYEIAYVPDAVDICHTYPLGMVKYSINACGTT